MTADRAHQLVVLYASQTGNAEWIAKHIHEEALARGFQSQCYVLDDFTKVDLTKNIAMIIVASTTGDGDPPDNATKFWRWLRRAKKPELDAIQGKKYALLGLGDTNYSNFCNTAKRLDRKFTDLGAVSFVAKGFADDATGLEEVVDPWIQKLWDSLPSNVEYDEAKAQHYVSSGGKKKSLFNNKSGKSEDEEKEDGNGDVQAVAQKVEKLEVKPSASETAALPSQTTQSEDHSSLANGLSTDERCHQGEAYDAVTKIVIDRAVVEAATELKGVPKLPAEFLNVTASGEHRTPEDSRSGQFDLYKSPVSSAPYDYTASSPFVANIASVRTLTGRRALKRVIEVSLDLTGLGWEYVPGDAFGVVCPNPDALVLPILEKLGLAPSQTFTMEPREAGGSSGLPFETAKQCTYYEAVKYFLDLHSLPRKAFFRVLAEYTTDAFERRTLLFLSSTQGATTYRNLRLQQPTLLDILHTFPSCNPPFARLLETVPRLQPRYYSVASSPTTSPAAVSFAFNIVEYHTEQPFNKPVRGLCSTWLDELTGRVEEQGKVVDLSGKEIRIPVFPKPPVDFRLPENSDTPLIMIAAGTGITPFMGFLAHRRAEKEGGKSVGGAWLFHGRRFWGEDGDALYKGELEGLKREGVLTGLHECVSRDRLDEVRYRYVQDAVKENGREVWELVNSGASVFVCGSVNMAKEVNQALVDIAQQVGGLASPVEGQAFWTQLAKEKRYLRDIWS
ncbi:hypothetical protein HDV00_000348 [Rhizophlyctis rosea]|nr:hypothetical protein HDV00_000348 [Rhizophlyctis rosea]